MTFPRRVEGAERPDRLVIIATRIGVAAHDEQTPPCWPNGTALHYTYTLPRCFSWAEQGSTTGNPELLYFAMTRQLAHLTNCSPARQITGTFALGYPTERVDHGLHGLLGSSPEQRY